MRVDQLGLRGTARQAATDFEARYPGTLFTSGRRGLLDQCRAMAQNVAVNRKWIEQTYKQPLCAAARAAQAWVDLNPLTITVGELTRGLHAILLTLSDDQLALLSCHLSGDAFDVAPDDRPDKDAFLHALAVKYKGKFLDVEGGLKRRHWQARP